MSIERSKLVDGSQNKKPKLPVGESGKLFLDQEEQEQSVYFGWVKNKVLKVNSNINIDDFPFDFIEGKPTSMGLFAETVLSEQSFNIISAEGQILEVLPQHKRSALLGRVSIKDREGRIYSDISDIDLKGIGIIEIYNDKVIIFPPGGKRLGGGRIGFLDRDVAFYDYDMSEKFFQAGIRTYRVLAIIELKELIINGCKISLEEAIKEDIIDENFHPVVEVRAYCGTKARVMDVIKNTKNPNYNKKQKLLIEDAKKILAREFNLKKPLSDEEYLEKFAELLGKNVGLIHKNGWVHNFISPHNVTLDGGIVDLDSVDNFNDQKAKEDFFHARETLLGLKSFFSPETGQEWKKYKEIFEKSYNEAFSQKGTKKHKT